MAEQTNERTAFGRVLSRAMEARGLASGPEAVRDLAERSGLDAGKFLALATSDPGVDLGPLSGLDDELKLSGAERRALSAAYVFDRDDDVAVDLRETWTPEERARYDARSEVEAWDLARKILAPWVESARPIGSDELTRVMEKALAEVDEALARARRARAAGEERNVTDQQPGAWVPRAERRVSPTPRRITPHPDHGDLPPCEHGIGGAGGVCPRPATTLNGFGYYCEEHTQAKLAAHRFDQASLDIHHAKRLLWRAHEEGIFRLEHHIGEALAELEEELLEAERAMNAAHERADRVGDPDRPGEEGAAVRAPGDGS